MIEVESTLDLVMFKEKLMETEWNQWWSLVSDEEEGAEPADTVWYNRWYGMVPTAGSTLP